jgi:hypothetical protein
MNAAERAAAERMAAANAAANAGGPPDAPPVVPPVVPAAALPPAAQVVIGANASRAQECVQPHLQSGHAPYYNALKRTRLPVMQTA